MTLDLAHLQTRSILVTGGAGFIGSHLVDALLRRGARVTAVDNFNDYYSPMIKERNVLDHLQHPSYRLVRGTILDDRILAKCFDARIDMVVHLAAWAGVRPSLARPDLYMEQNVTGTTKLLEAMRKAEVKRLILASSSSVYGAHLTVPFDEGQAIDRPASPYAASKRACELLCSTWHDLYGIESNALRFFTVYGPRQRPEMAIAQFARLIEATEPVPMYGDGTTSRDYTYVDDIIQGVLGALSYFNGFQIYNLGESRVVELKLLIDVLGQALGKTPQIKTLPLQPGDVPRTYARIEKAKLHLGYAPRTSIQTGLRAYVQWLRDQKTI